MLEIPGTGNLMIQCGLVGIKERGIPVGIVDPAVDDPVVFQFTDRIANISSLLYSPAGQRKGTENIRLRYRIPDNSTMDGLFVIDGTCYSGSIFFRVQISGWRFLIQRFFPALLILPKLIKGRKNIWQRKAFCRSLYHRIRRKRLDNYILQL